MAKIDQSDNIWRAEARREERKNRLADLKSAKGGQRIRGRRSSWKIWLATAGVVAVLLGIVVYAGFANGIPHRTLALMRVGDRKISVATFNYWYGNVLSQYGLNANSPELDSPLAAGADDATTTTRQYLLSITATQLQRVYAEATLAREAGLELGEYAEAVDRQVESIIAAAGSAGYADMMLKQTYGPGCTVGVVRKLYENLYLSTKFAAAKTAEVDVSSEALAQHYTEHAGEIDTVDYRAFSFPYTMSTTATAAEREQAQQAAQKKADAFLAAIQTEADFQQQALAATEEGKQNEYAEKDGSLIAGMTASGLVPQIAEWAFDPARQAGDLTVIDTTADFTVLYFLQREQPQQPQASVRHILLSANRETATTGQLQAARAQAEALQAQITDEASFVALVRTESDDVASVADGGLFTGLDEKSGFVTEFLTWAIDAARQPGDIGIVQTEYGYHLMYFVEWVPAWENTVRDRLQTQSYEEYITDLLVNDARFDYNFGSFARRFIH